MAIRTMPPSNPVPLGRAPEQGRARVRFTGATGMTVRGPVTGLAYAFSPAQPVRNIDARDAAAMLRTKLFRAI